MIKNSEKIIKSRKRVKEQGEVFTQDREVKNILALTQATDNIFWKFLEPACGNGNFLVEIVTQRLERIKNNPTYRPADKREFVIIKTLSTVYGIDIAEDNIAECKKRILKVVSSIAPKKPSSAFTKAVKSILDTNIILGDSLNCKDKIFFVEYGFPGNEYLSRTKIKRSIYNLQDMENGVNRSVDILPLIEPYNMNAINPAQYYVLENNNQDEGQIELFNIGMEVA